MGIREIQRNTDQRNTIREIQISQNNYFEKFMKEEYKGGSRVGRKLYCFDI